MTVAPMIPTARSVASEFGSVGTNTPRATPDPETGRQEDLDCEPGDDRSHERRDHRLPTSPAAFLEREHTERDRRGDQPRQEERQ